MSEESPAYTVTPTPFPAATKSSTASIHGAQTTATTTYFADKILITVSQAGKLAQWIHVPLDIAATDAPLTNAYSELDDDAPSSDLLPMHHLTATHILGGTNSDIAILGQTLATQIASAIKTRDASETRMVVMGLGLDQSVGGRDDFSELVGLVLGVL